MESNEIKWHHFPVTKQIWTQLYVGKYLSTKPSFQTFFSEIQHSFPAQIAISFEIKIGLALDICHFFSETAHFLPEIAPHGQNSLHPLKLLISPKTMSARKTFLCCAGCIAGHK